MVRVIAIVEIVAEEIITLGMLSKAVAVVMIVVIIRVVVAE